MNDDPAKARAKFAWTVAGVAAFGLFGGLTWEARNLIQPPPMGQERIAARVQAFSEARAADRQALTTAAWEDRAKGVVRLPIETALGLAAREWQDPAQARSNLIARARRTTVGQAGPSDKPGHRQ